MRPTFVAPGARPRAGDRPRADPGLAGGGARRDPGRGRGDGRLPHLLRRLRRRRRRWPRSPTSAACRWSSTRPGAPTCTSTPTCPPDALASGADLVTSSTHKIVGSLTQAAMLHLGHGGRIDAGGRRPLRQPGRNDQPQRPALRLARRRPAPGRRPRRGAARRDPGGDRRDPRGDRARSPASPCSTRAWSAGPGSPAGTRCGSRSTSAAPARPATGWRKPPSTTSGIDLELYSENVVVAIFGLGEPAARGRRAAGRRRCARRSASSEAEPGAPDEKLAPPPPWGELVMTPREAFLGPQEVVPFDAAAGRIAAEGLAAYPPGIPNVLPGERLTARDARLHPRERRPRRLRPRRQRPRAEDAAGRPLRRPDRSSGLGRWPPSTRSPTCRSRSRPASSRGWKSRSASSNG